MATDLHRIVQELSAFHDFANKDVIVVGGGGGQLIDYLLNARRVVAIDQDAPALAALQRLVEQRGLAGQFELMHGDFLSVHPPGDVLVLEFCLHEMEHPYAAIEHARELACDVVVIDHAPGSPWSHCAMEDRGVEAGWAAASRFPIQKQRNVHGVQCFRNFAELEARLRRNRTPTERISVFRDRSPITIPMPYRMALIAERARGGM